MDLNSIAASLSPLKPYQLVNDERRWTAHPFATRSSSTSVAQKVQNTEMLLSDEVANNRKKSKVLKKA